MWSVKHTSIFKNFELTVSKNIKFLDKLSGNLPTDLLGTNVYKAFKSSW